MGEDLVSDKHESSGETMQLCLSTISVVLPITGKNGMRAGVNLQVTVQCNSVKDLQTLLHKSVDELFENWDAESFGITVPVVG